MEGPASSRTGLALAQHCLQFVPTGHSCIAAALDRHSARLCPATLRTAIALGRRCPSPPAPPLRQIAAGAPRSFRGRRGQRCQNLGRPPVAGSSSTHCSAGPSRKPPDFGWSFSMTVLQYAAPLQQDGRSCLARRRGAWRPQSGPQGWSRRRWARRRGCPGTTRSGPVMVVLASARGFAVDLVVWGLAQCHSGRSAMLFGA